jgi:predicted RNase H-like HicB family nuclease
MKELIFEVLQEEDDGYCAECLTENIFSQGNTWDELRNNVKEAVKAYYFDTPQIACRVRLHLVRDEVLA